MKNKLILFGMLYGALVGALGVWLALIVYFLFATFADSATDSSRLMGDLIELAGATFTYLIAWAVIFGGSIGLVSGGVGGWVVGRRGEIAESARVGTFVGAAAGCIISALIAFNGSGGSWLLLIEIIVLGAIFGRITGHLLKRRFTGDVLGAER